MTNTVLLTPDEHKQIKIDTRHGSQLGAEYGDSVNACLSFVGEFRTVQAHYPIVFQRDGQSGLFHPVVVLGFEIGENLFLQESHWDAPYIPALIARQPFSIGFKSTPDSDEKQRVVHIDLDNPRVSQEQGEPLFMDLGEQSPYLQKMASLLESIHLGMEQNKAFSAALIELELVESFSAEIELNDGTTHQLLGYYTINEEKLYKLSAEKLAELNEKGFLSAVYMMLASLSQFSNLIARKNATLLKA
ncbi:SapC family protein [Alteromonas sp. a30]|uniref:SapC family protein n=1 Tax=Alteromonas sp. a30 TaxID=2730917 RepID=UPI00227EE0E9|nr:SapC family protein [Alteromonas sp. a30]MCY7294045.1 SapC family protein [Alteromonas sp. a30]